ncbi:MAG: XRE family transcriptional regulator [Cellvibrionaceae bacterium]|nr:XRE family transcriptional regulator [Cellvibrionaceae bacterium]
MSVDKGEKRGDKGIESGDVSVLAVARKDDDQFVEPLQLGKRLKEIRLANNLTLEEASQLTGLARSTLSKIENEQISPTFQAVQKLTKGLGIDIPQLFVSPSEGPGANGRRDVTPAGSGKAHPTSTYEHELLATNIRHKKMVPFKCTVRARSFAEFDDWVRHEGEEFMLVLSGEVEVHTEFYEPLRLAEGDSMYYDATMGHCLVSTSEDDAQVLWVTSR